jgi:RimJ/RimL family protein N-acetyltransferase
MTSFEGDLVRLRPIDAGDLEFFVSLEYDDEGIRGGGGFVPVPYSKAKLAKWVEEQATKEGQNDIYRFVAVSKASEEPVAVLNTHTVDRRTGNFGYGIQVAPDHRRRGFASDAIKTALRYFFAELRYQKCNVEVYSFNEPSLSLHRKLGFTQEGRLRRTKYTNGAFHDEILFGMTIEEFS